MPTNLQSDITEVRARLGEPYRTDEADSFFLDSEIIDWIYYGEVKVWNDLPTPVLVNGTTGLGLASAWNCSAGSGLGNYVDDGFDEPATLSGISYRIVQVRMAVSSSLTVPGREVGLDVIQSIARGKNRNYPRPCLAGGDLSIPYFLWHQATGGNIYSSAGRVGDFIDVEVLKQPTRRTRHYRGTSNAAGNSNTNIRMDAAGLALAFPTGFFTSSDYLKITSGIMSGVQPKLTGYTLGATADFSFASIGPSPGNSVLYEVGETSAFNDNLREPTILHACYLAALKDESPERSQGFMALYASAIAALKG
jgi:hypothetical protein